MERPFIHANDLAWITPDGRELFTGLTLSFGQVRTGLVGRNGVGKTTLLKILAGEVSPSRGSVTHNSHVRMLRQMVRVAPDETVADLFEVAKDFRLLQKAAQGAADVDELMIADWTLEDRVSAALRKVKLDLELSTRLAPLSGGERTRAALAACIFHEPDFLLLDEPTNNMDREGREEVISLLSTQRGGTIVVSHDRGLLEHMETIVELTSVTATRYGGNWPAYRHAKDLELEAAAQGLAVAERRADEAARRAQRLGARKARRDASGSRKGASGGLPRILAGGRKDRAQATSGAHARLADRQREEARMNLASARDSIEAIENVVVSLPPTGLVSDKVVLQVRDATVVYAPETPVLRNLSFTIIGPERVALTGANGSGKSTLFGLLSGDIIPVSGTVQVMVPFAFLDQRTTALNPGQSILTNFQRINPSADENACHAALARFRFRATEAQRVAGTLSGGQTLLASLACVFGHEAAPKLLMLDEPTNHLDWDSVEALADGLRAYDGALLVASHDEAFLRTIGMTRNISL